jgi:hypothetical protein
VFVAISIIFWCGLFRKLVLFDILFIYLFIIAYSRSISLGADDYENLQELDIQDFEQQVAEEQGK